ncbi:MAG: ribose 5-phosphate isomerase B [Bacteroidia bacterium]
MQRIIPIAADHAGYDLKELLKKQFSSKEMIFEDLGTHSSESMDYPDIVHPLAKMIEADKSKLGILICGSANGVAITANKHAGVRAAICWNPEIAALARLHNNANVLCLPARFISNELAFGIVKAFFDTQFEGGRHQRRVDKMTC